MKYRREDQDDYTFGKGEGTFLTDSAECVAQAIKTRLQLWYGQWFLDTTEGTPWMQSLMGKRSSTAMELALRQRILATEGVKSILSFTVNFNPSTRRMVITTTVETLFGQITLTSEA